MRLKFWKGMIDRVHRGDSPLINLLISSFDSDQAMEALQYLETYVQTHLESLVECSKTISIIVENESEPEFDPFLQLLVSAVLALIPALSADSVHQAWDLLYVLEFTVKTQWSEPTRVFQSICTSPYWIPFWKQIVVREMDPNNCGKQPVWFVRFLDSDKVMGLALDTMLQTISELEIHKSDAPVYKAFIERQLKLLQPLCVDVIGEQAPKLIGILADIVRTMSFGDSGDMRSCLNSLNVGLSKLHYHYVGHNSGEFESNVDKLIRCYSILYSTTLDYLPICGSEDCHLNYITIEIDRNAKALCRNLSGQRYHSIFVLAIELKHLDVLYNLGNKKSELRLHHIEKCFPMVLSKLNKEEGVGKLIACLAPEMSDGMLLQLLNAILKLLPNYSPEASVDCHLHGSCFPVLSNVLAQRGFVEHVQPLVQFLFRNIDYKWGFDLELVKNMERVVMTVIRHLSSITLSDMVVLWNRIHEDLLYISEALTIVFTEQMAILINKKSASIEDMERLLLEDLERETFKTSLVNVCLWNGFLVMKAVRLLRKQVVGFIVPYMSNVQSPELDYVAQMLDPCSGLVITNNVASCLKEVWVESVFCEASRFFELRASEESPVTGFSSSGADFRRVLSTDIISIWKSVLERDATWFERVDFGKRLKLLYEKYGLVWVADSHLSVFLSVLATLPVQRTLWSF
ncbi:hypothetical protein DFJ73DRAFT_964400 [Zopfochytrium polystomum]|nr:hypothetical protein DFJ73DRAFT_964400 [Zopfochytrium polystomum]